MHTTQYISVWFLYGGHLKLPHVVLTEKNRAPYFLDVSLSIGSASLSIIFDIVPSLFSHKKPRIFCLPSTIAFLFTWNQRKRYLKNEMINIFSFYFLMTFNHSNCATITVTSVRNSWHCQAPFKCFTILSALFVV